jgi:hypothetical protein
MRAVRTTLILCLSLAAGLAVAADQQYRIFWWSSQDIITGWTENDGFPEGYYYKRNPGPALDIFPVQVAVCDGNFSNLHVFTLSTPSRYMRWTEPTTEWWTGGGIFQDVPVDELSKLGQGKFYAALVHGGMRLSNILPFTVQSSKPVPSGPSLQVVGISALDQPQVSVLGIRFISPNTTDPKLLYSTVYEPDLIVDGVPRHLTGIDGVGFDGPLKPNTSINNIVDLSDYDPPVAPSATHQVQVIIGQYKSPVTTVSIDPTVAQQFDAVLAKATESPAPLAAAPTSAAKP